MTLLRADLRAFVAQQLITAGTAAGTKVYQNRALTTDVASLPIIVLTTPHERKDPLSRGSTLYTTVITLHAAIRVAANPSNSYEAAATAAELLMEQVLAATVGNQAMLNFEGLQQFAGIESYLKVDATGGVMIAEVDMVFSVELIERIDPTTPVPFTGIQVTVTDPSGDPTNHLLAVFDADLPQ